MLKTSAATVALAVSLGLIVAAPVAVVAPASADEVAVTYDRLIAGATNAKIERPMSVDVAPDGRVVVSSAGIDVGGNDSSIRIFASSATGDVAPAATVEHTLPSPWIGNVRGIAAGPDGRIHVGLQNDNSVRTFVPSGGTYAQAPLPDGVNNSAGVSGPVDVAALSATHLWVVSSGTGEVVLFSVGGVGRLRTLATSNPRGVAVRGTSTYVSGGIGASSYVKVYGLDSDVTPIAEITGPATGITSVGGLDIDSLGRIYVTDPDDHSIRVFAAGADGDDAPVKVLRLPAPSPLPEDVALDGAANIWVVNGNDAGSAGRIRALDAPPVAPATRPSKPRSLKVKGKPGAVKRVVRWKAPARTGGTPVLRYKVVVKKGSKRLVKRTVPASKRELVLKRSKLRSGVHTVRVRAINAEGASPNVVKRFRVRK